MAETDDQPSQIYRAEDIAKIKSRIEALDRRLLSTEGAMAGDLVDIEGRLDALEGRQSSTVKRADYAYLSWLLPAVAGIFGVLWLLWEAYGDDS